MSCKCQNCGKQYRIDLIVPDDLWERIKPEGKAEGAGLLFPKCIGEKIEGLDIYTVYKLVGTKLVKA